MADFELLDDDYFPALADELSNLVEAGELPSSFDFREERVELPDAGLVSAALAGARAMSLDVRGRDWRPTVLSSVRLNMIDDVEVDSVEGVAILKAVAAGSAALGDIAMLCSHANTQICGSIWETPAERRELARMKGLFAVSQLALRQIFGNRLVTEARLPQIGDTITSVFNPGSAGTLKEIFVPENDFEATQLVAIKDDGGDVVLVADEGTVVLESREFEPLHVIMPDETRPTFH
jgi:hypothetical protein